MIAIINSKNQAIELSDKIHLFLKEKRKGYSAECWCDLNKHQNKEFYAVPIPEEYVEINNLELVNNLPEDWYKIDEIFSKK